MTFGSGLVVVESAAKTIDIGKSIDRKVRPSNTT